MAALVTITDAIVALPFAYYMARVASPRARRALFTAVLLPLWASYLARVYAWIVILQKGGTLSWTFQKLGLGSVNIGYTNTAMWIVFSYIWLPFMIVPVYGSVRADPGLAARGVGRPRSARAGGRCAASIMPLALPGDRRRVDLHLLADARRLHHPAAGRRLELAVHRQRDLLEHRHRQQPAVRGGARARADRDHDRVPDRRPVARARSRRCDDRGHAWTRILLRVWVVLVLLFLFVPIATIVPVRVQQVQRPELADQRA